MILDSAREAFFMFWETLWALVLGFGLSGIVQAFVAKEDMQRVLGDHRAPSVLRASGFGMVSSSCSYAATAMAKSLFQKGADFVSAMVFMFASTNLVLELGIVLAVLMGWQFAAAEFVGGPIMIVLLVLVGGFVFRGTVVERARARLERELGPQHHHGEMRSKAAWADAASYAMADVTMLRKELFIGYGIAGVLSATVSMDVWNDVFLRGHGVWTTIENVLVGPIIACISFVCSVGNVPMAAALWHGGISFGGVVSFVFADLIALPLILIYRKYYGTALTLRLVGVFYGVMAVAGLLTEWLFSAAGAIPTSRPHQVVTTRFEWNYTTFLNIAFLALFAGMWWLHRNRARFGGGEGLAIDPICGMQVVKANAPATAVRNGERYWFCSDRCRERFESGADDDTHLEDHMAIDPVCHMTVDPATAAAVRQHDGRNYFFCNPGCADAFEAEPDRYLTESPS